MGIFGGKKRLIVLQEYIKKRKTKKTRYLISDIMQKDNFSHIYGQEQVCVGGRGGY